MEFNNINTNINDYGSYSSKCGYCGNTDGFKQHGMQSNKMTVDVYQDLIDVGWRRSGTYVYKPELKSMCCPCYTIRLNAEKFVPCKKQQKTMRKFHRYIEGEDINSNIVENNKEIVKENGIVINLMCDIIQRIYDEYANLNNHPKLKIMVQYPKMKKSKESRNILCCTPSFLSLLSKRNQDAKNMPLCMEDIKSITNIISDTFNKNILNNEITLNTDDIKDYIMQLKAESNNGYINIISDDIDIIKHLKKYNDTSIPQKDEKIKIPVQLKKRKFEKILIKSEFIEEEYGIYRRYQMAVHKDPEHKCSKYTYDNFLVMTPLVYKDSSNSEITYGSYHLQYRIDNKLVAVSVLDILPRGISSKYLLYDPDYSFLSIGKISALTEIEMVTEMKTKGKLEDFKYYYMGYFINSCPKMRYKADYKPSELLCPVGLCWVTLTDEIMEKIKEEEYQILSSFKDVECEENKAMEMGIGSAREQIINLQDNLLKFKDVLNLPNVNKKSVERIKRKIKTWIEMVGPCHQKIAYMLR